MKFGTLKTCRPSILGPQKGSILGKSILGPLQQFKSWSFEKGAEEKVAEAEDHGECGTNTSKPGVLQTPLEGLLKKKEKKKWDEKSGYEKEMKNESKRNKKRTIEGRNPLSSTCLAPNFCLFAFQKCCKFR